MNECERCEALEQLFEGVEKLLNEVQISEEQRVRLKFEFSQCKTSIKEWKAHLLRTTNQEEAKQYVLSKLDDESCLVIMDWAMKFLPTQYREKMEDFFGKPGLSWHVSAVITTQRKVGDGKTKFEVECFIHLFNKCTQDSFAVLSIIEDLLKNVKADYSKISQVYFRSDNAGCYHNGALLLSLPKVGERTGIRPIRYDFSEPQSGKDVCDRKTASMKAHIRRWVDEKHNVSNAEEMKEALESHGGLKGCRAAVVEVDTTKEENQGNKIPGISVLNNFKFEKTGIRVWKAFNVGSGRLLKYKDLNVQPQGDTGLKVIQPFCFSMKERGTVGESSRKNTKKIFSCIETGCILNFSSQSELDEHLETGEHKRLLETESMYDKIRMKWASKVTGMAVQDDPRPSTSTNTTDSGELREKRSESSKRAQGWALKSIKKSSRMTDKVKKFLENKFADGARSGLKADPAQLAKEMKVAKNKEGQFIFEPEEWRTTKQIRNLFSRLKVLQNQRGIGEEMVTEEDIQALEAEIDADDLRTTVLNDIVSPEHPIVVGVNNVCELVSSNKLRSLKLAVLKEISQELEVEPNGSSARKKSYCEPIEDLVKQCSCMKDQ